MKHLGLKTAALSSAILLASCGGGSSSGSPTSLDGVINGVNPGGIWTGTISGNGQTIEIVGFITENGEMRLINEQGTQSVGTINTNGQSFTGTGTSFAPYGQVFIDTNTSTVAYTATGNINERNSLTGTSYINGQASSTLNLTYDPLYDRDSNLNTIAGIYSDTDGSYVETYTIDSDGNLTGSDTDGCIFNGNVSIIDANYNMYRVQFIVSNCGLLNGTYQGLAALTDEGGSTNDTLSITVSGNNIVVSGLIPRT